MRDIQHILNETEYMREKPAMRNVIAYCHNKKHKGYLSPGMIKDHDCIGKQCPLLEKHEDTYYWASRAVKNVLKKYRKNGSTGAIYINGVRYMSDNLDFLTNIYLSIYRKTGNKPSVELRSSILPRPAHIPYN